MPNGLRRRRESFVSSHRETKATAPVLDSTPDYTHHRVALYLPWLLAIRLPLSILTVGVTRDQMTESVRSREE